MIRIDRMSLWLPADTVDPRAAAHAAAEEIGRALARSEAAADRLSVVVAPGQRVGAAVARALRDEARRRG